MRSFGPINPHGTAFSPKQWLYLKETMDMESSKIYFRGWCRYRTYQCVAANYPVSWGGSIGPKMEICGTSGLPIPMVERLRQSNGYMKRKLRAWRVQKCIALVGADTVLTSSWPKTTPFYWGYYRVQKGNMRSFGPTNPHGTAFSPKQWLYQKETMDMESSKIYFRGWCRYRTFQSGAAN